MASQPASRTAYVCQECQETLFLVPAKPGVPGAQDSGYDKVQVGCPFARERKPGEPCQLLKAKDCGHCGRTA